MGSSQKVILFPEHAAALNPGAAMKSFRHIRSTVESCLLSHLLIQTLCLPVCFLPFIFHVHQLLPIRFTTEVMLELANLGKTRIEQQSYPAFVMVIGSVYLIP